MSPNVPSILTHFLLSRFLIKTNYIKSSFMYIFSPPQHNEGPTAGHKNLGFYRASFFKMRICFLSSIFSVISLCLSKALFSLQHSSMSYINSFSVCVFRGEIKKRWGISNIWKRQQRLEDYLKCMQEKLALDISLCPTLRLS